jgi:hypothetical protein
MIVAGVDEAGYGPLLGPLVVGCCAIRVRTEPGEPPPCLWTRLSHSVSRTRCRNGRKLHINDSKLVYTPSNGLGELEQSVLAVASTLWGWSEHLTALLDHLSPGLNREMGDYPWYNGLDESFPLSCNAASARIHANALRLDLQRTDAQFIHLHAQVILERRLNQMLSQTRNKASTLFSIAARHLDHLLNHYADEDLLIFCDRQGGREHYGSLLRLMFQDWDLTVLCEQEHRSEYLLSQGARSATIVFMEKAEAQAMPVAVASMISKYLREALMGRFNRYWQRLLPGLAPTAGYYTDGTRFLRDIAHKCQELGITDELLIRSR